MATDNTDNNGRLKFSLYRYLRRLNAWDWLVGIVVAVSLFFATGFTGHGLYILIKASLAQVLLDRAWAAMIELNEPQKPWPWFDSWPIARIAVPRLQEQAVVLQGASGQALAFGPAHVDGTASPGERGLTVYAAHRDTHFAFMDDLKVGDIVEVTNKAGRRFKYEIEVFRIARWDSSGLDPSRSGHQLALVTCWPLDAMTVGPMRYIAEATLVTPKENTNEIATN